MTRVVVLGGAGWEAQGIVKDLVRSGVSEVVLADIQEDRAREIAADMMAPHTRVVSQLVDANDAERLVETIRGADVVVSALGPFYRYGIKTLRAAIDARVPYVDINDDYDATQQALTLNDEAVRADVTAVIGLGVSPGVSNVCARHGAGRLDQVDTIYIAWIGAAGPGGPAVLLHCFHGLADKIPVYSDGELKFVRPLEEPKRPVIFPDPFGPVEAPCFGHTEPITLPKFIKGVKAVAVRASLFPSIYQQTLERLAQLGLLSKEPVSVGGIRMAPRDFVLACFETVIETPAMHREVESALETLPTLTYGSLMVEVSGNRSGGPVRYTYVMNADLCDATDWPASIGAQMLARGDIQQRGVLTPEQCIDPEPFFRELKKRGITIDEKQETTRAL